MRGEPTPLTFDDLSTRRLVIKSMHDQTLLGNPVFSTEEKFSRIASNHAVSPLNWVMLRLTQFPDGRQMIMAGRALPSSGDWDDFFLKFR